MNEKVDRDRAAIQQHTRHGQQSALRSLEHYVENRRRTLFSFERMDPHSQHTRDAQVLLEKAIADRDEYAAFVAQFGSAELLPPNEP